jgi:hypothetical protein
MLENKTLLVTSGRAAPGYIRTATTAPMTPDQLEYAKSTGERPCER